jgi:hypothetical protein
MFLHVTEVNYLEDYKLRLRFDNGIIKDVDLRDELYGQYILISSFSWKSPII